MLAAARERRSRPIQRCAKVEKVEDVDTDVDAESAAAKDAVATEEHPRRRNCIDPMFLWGAKPIAAKKEAPKPTAVRRCHSIGGEGVAFGENSLLSRLRKRVSTIE